MYLYIYIPARPQRKQKACIQGDIFRDLEIYCSLPACTPSRNI